MLPIQDAVPSGRVPRATIALIVINVLAAIGQLVVPDALPTHILLSPFLHLSATHFVVAILFLWLFGDNVEARIGRPLFVTLYFACGMTGSWLASALTAEITSIGAASAVTGVLGAYFMLLPRSRILVWVPVPLDLAEAPALFFLGVWWMLLVVSVILGPWAAPRLLWPLVIAFSIGAVLCLVRRPKIVW